MQGVKTHSVVLSLNVADMTFQTTGDHHLMTQWRDLVGSAEFSYRNSKNAVITQGLKDIKGVQNGCCYRINIIPNSVNTAAAQIQIFPRALKTLKRLCTHNGVSLSSTKIPGILIHPSNAQALAIRMGPRDSSNGINMWPMLVFNGKECYKEFYRFL